VQRRTNIKGVKLVRNRSIRTDLKLIKTKDSVSPRNQLVKPIDVRCATKTYLLSIKGGKIICFQSNALRMIEIMHLHYRLLYNQNLITLHP
jgi:hypothetical protein